MLTLVLKLIKNLLEDLMGKFTQILYCSEDIKQDRDIVTMVEQEAEMAAAVELIRAAGGNVIGCSFVIDLPDLGGRKRLEAMGLTVQTLCAFEGL